MLARTTSSTVERVEAPPVRGCSTLTVLHVSLGQLHSMERQQTVLQTTGRFYDIAQANTNPMGDRAMYTWHGKLQLAIRCISVDAHAADRHVGRKTQNTYPSLHRFRVSVLWAT